MMFSDYRIDMKPLCFKSPRGSLSPQLINFQTSASKAEWESQTLTRYAQRQFNSGDKELVP